MHEHLDLGRMPGHWLLARMGKRVLRPGGLELTSALLEDLRIGTGDRVVELAPGLGATARLVLARKPESYVGVERDEAAAQTARQWLRAGDEIRHGSAIDTGLESSSASVVFGEAMLTMQTESQKAAIVREARRILRVGGRYGIHELALRPDDLPEREKNAIQRELSESIHVGARPLTSKEWKDLLESSGFDVITNRSAPMHLLEPARLASDEGLFGALRFVTNVLKSPEARKRVLAMRSVFEKYGANLCAIGLVARKERESRTALLT